MSEINEAVKAQKGMRKSAFGMEDSFSFDGSTGSMMNTNPTPTPNPANNQSSTSEDLGTAIGEGLGEVSRKAWGVLGVTAANGKYLIDAVGNIPRLWGGKNMWGDDFQGNSWLDYNKAGWQAGNDSAETMATGMAQGMASTVGINSDTLNAAEQSAKSQMRDLGYDESAVETAHGGARAAGQLAGEATLMKGLGAVGKPLANSGNKVVRRIGKALPYVPVATKGAVRVAGGVADVANAVQESIAAKKRQLEQFKKMFTYGGTALGGLMALMLAKGLIGGNGGGSSGSGEEKRKKSAWEQMLDSVLMAGAVGAGAYGGYKLSDPAFNYLYDKVRWDAIGKGIKSVWNDVKAKFS